MKKYLLPLMEAWYLTNGLKRPLSILFFPILILSFMHNMWIEIILDFFLIPFFLRIATMLGINKAIGSKISFSTVIKECQLVKGKLAAISIVYMFVQHFIFYIRFIISNYIVEKQNLYTLRSYNDPHIWNSSNYYETINTYLHLKAFSNTILNISNLLLLVMFIIISEVIITKRCSLRKALKQTFKIFSLKNLINIIVMIAIVQLSFLPLTEVIKSPGLAIIGAIFGSLYILPIVILSPVLMIWSIPMFFALIGVLFKNNFGLVKRTKSQTHNLSFKK